MSFTQSDRKLEPIEPVADLAAGVPRGQVVRKREFALKHVLVMAAVAALLVTYVAQASLPENAVTLPGQKWVAAISPRLTPQGWAFFTRPAASSELVAYKVGTDGGLSSASLGANADPKNSFGWDRRSRLQGVEYALITSNVARNDWTACDGDGTLGACKEVAEVSGQKAMVQNVTPNPSLCGEYMFFEQVPVPWAWKSLTGERWKFTRGVEVGIKC